MTDKLRQGDSIRLSVEGMTQNRWRYLHKIRISGVRDVSTWLYDHNDNFPEVLQRAKNGETAIITKVMYRNTKVMSANGCVYVVVLMQHTRCYSQYGLISTKL